MVNVIILTESRFPVNREKIKLSVLETIKKQQVNGNVEVEIVVVGDRKMRALSRTYRKLNETTDVLAFPLDDPRARDDFVRADDGILRLGSVVVSYPQAVVGAGEENELVDVQIGKLVEHGVLHLLGIHHD